MTTAQGILLHHFWGEYSAEVYLRFDTEWEAVGARALLSRETGMEWKHKETSIGIHVNSEQLSKVEEVLARHGAEEGKISSLATSVDHGEPFTCSFNIEHPDQLELTL